MTGLSFDVSHLLAGALVLVSFMLLYQTRLYALLNVFALQAVVLSLSVAWQAYVQNAPHLYITAAIAFLFKALIIPIAMHRIIARLGIERDVENVVGIGPTMLAGLALVALSIVVMLRIASEADALDTCRRGRQRDAAGRGDLGRLFRAGRLYRDRRVLVPHPRPVRYGRRASARSVPGGPPLTMYAFDGVTAILVLPGRDRRPAVADPLLSALGDDQHRFLAGDAGPGGFVFLGQTLDRTLFPHRRSQHRLHRAQHVRRLYDQRL